MKRYLSVYALAARASFIKVVAVTVLAAAASAILLLGAPQGKQLKIVCFLPAILGFIAISVMLSRLGTGKGSQPFYTVMRLRIKPRMVTFIWAIYNSIMLMFYRAMLMLVFYGVISGKIKNIGPQAVLIASYGNSYLHNLLPLRAYPAWMLLISATLLMGCTCAFIPENQWRGKNRSFLLIAVMICSIAFMRIPMGSALSAIFSFACIGVIAWIAIDMYAEEENDESHQ